MMIMKMTKKEVEIRMTKKVKMEEKKKKKNHQ